MNIVAIINDGIILHGSALLVFDDGISPDSNKRVKEQCSFENLWNYLNKHKKKKKYGKNAKGE